MIQIVVCGSKEEEMDFPELSEKMSTCVNIRYRLRSRTICDCKKHAAHNAQNNVSVVQESNDMFTSEPPNMMIPNKILTKIFSYINVRELRTSVAPVCKFWHLIAHSPVLWRKLCFDGERISTEFAKSLLTKCPLLSEVIISSR